MLSFSQFWSVLLSFRFSVGGSSLPATKQSPPSMARQNVSGAGQNVFELILISLPEAGWRRRRKVAPAKRFLMGAWLLFFLYYVENVQVWGAGAL